MEGLFRWNVSYVLHDTMLIPSSCGMLVYRLVTSIDTSIVPFFRQFKVANRQFKNMSLYHGLIGTVICRW